MPFSHSSRKNSTKPEPMQMDLQQVVNLARIELTPEELEHLGPQLEGILKYVEKLDGLDLEGVEPTAHAVPLTNVLREDEPRESLSHEAAMRNAPKTSNGLFIVPKIVE